VHPNGDTSPEPEARRSGNGNVPDRADHSASAQADMGTGSVPGRYPEPAHVQQDPETPRAVAEPQQGEPIVVEPEGRSSAPSPGVLPDHDVLPDHGADVSENDSPGTDSAGTDDSGALDPDAVDPGRSSPQDTIPEDEGNPENQDGPQSPGPQDRDPDPDTDPDEFSRAAHDPGEENTDQTSADGSDLDLIAEPGRVSADLFTPGFDLFALADTDSAPSVDLKPAPADPVAPVVGPVPDIGVPAGSAPVDPVPDIGVPAGSAPVDPVPDIGVPVGPAPVDPAPDIGVPVGPAPVGPAPDSGVPDSGVPDPEQGQPSDTSQQVGPLVWPATPVAGISSNTSGSGGGKLSVPASPENPARPGGQRNRPVPGRSLFGSANHGPVAHRPTAQNPTAQNPTGQNPREEAGTSDTAAGTATRRLADYKPLTADELVEKADVLDPYSQRSGTQPEALTDLLSSTETLREQVAGLSLSLDLTGVDQARAERENLLAQLDDYVLPRLRRMDAPLLAVIGGSTGAGKSTLVNSLVRREVSRSGVLRPTTRSPVLVHHPYDSGAFLSQRILPGLGRITETSLGPLQPIELDAPRATALRLVPHEGLCPGLAIVDAPDIDSVVETNRELAVQLLGAADLWLFVTTAARYSDALPWDTLYQAVDRGVTVAMILDRVPQESLRQIRTHLATRLREQGLGSSPVFVVPEMRPVGGLLPFETVAPLLSWLNRLAKDARSRDVVVRRTLAGALDSLPDRSYLLATAADRQSAEYLQLGHDLETGIVRSREDLAISLADSTVLRGEVLARWRELLGGGELMNGLESATSRLRGLLRRPKPLPSEPLARALRSAVCSLLRAAAQEAGDSVLDTWRERESGRKLVDNATRRPASGRIPTLLVSGQTSADQTEDDPLAEPDDEIARAVAQWYGAIVEVARVEGGKRRTTSRAVSLGVGGAAALATLLAVARPTSGPPEGQILASPADDAARVARRIMESVLGEQSTRTIVSRARRDLLQRAQTLIETEHVRLYNVLQASGTRPDQGNTLREAAQMVEEAR
jgi:GTPase SAR1 family protein